MHAHRQFLYRLQNAQHCRMGTESHKCSEYANTVGLRNPADQVEMTMLALLSSIQRRLTSRICATVSWMIFAANLIRTNDLRTAVEFVAPDAFATISLWIVEIIADGDAPWGAVAWISTRNAPV